MKAAAAALSHNVLNESRKHSEVLLFDCVTHLFTQHQRTCTAVCWWCVA